MAMVQGVGQVPPSDDRASVPDGSDWISRLVVVGFGFKALMPGMVYELQAVMPQPQITRT